MTINKQAVRQVSRYDLVSGYLHKWPEGELVYHSDYQALLDELEAAEKRIAELEVREVVLPQRISMEGGAYCTAHARYDEDGDYYYRDEVIESLVAAGIITNVGGVGI